MIAKILVEIVNNLLGKGFAYIAKYLKQRKIAKLEKQVDSLKDTVLILEKEKEIKIRIDSWEYRLKNKENESLVTELNRIRNKD